MGFETGAENVGSSKWLVWRFPMGFETVFPLLAQRLQACVWRFPMGFETFPESISSSPLEPVWRFPMGFETYNLPTHHAPRSASLKIPYGIWNPQIWCAFSFWACLKIPYGIWNCSPRMNGRMWQMFEDSLWDLKPLLDCPKPPSLRGLKIPYGIWNKVWWDTLSFYSLVWRFPMGFETKVFTWWLWQEHVWRFPMGFETRGVLYIFSFSFVWRFPMGFETSNSKSSLLSQPTFEDSLWDLKQILCSHYASST